jgi:hypothetical protein
LYDVITGTDPKENIVSVALAAVACLSVAIATFANTWYIAYSMHVTLFFLLLQFCMNHYKSVEGIL